MRTPSDSVWARFAVSFSLALLVFGATTGPTASADVALGDLRIAPDRIGPVVIGMAQDQVGSALGTVVTTNSSVNSCVFFGVPGLNGGTLQLLATAGARLDLILVNGPGIRSTKGIQVGSTLRRLRARYRGRLARAPRGNNLSAADKFYWVRSSAGSGNVLRFSVYNGRVSGMAAGPRSLVVNFGECA